MGRKVICQILEDDREIMELIFEGGYFITGDKIEAYAEPAEMGMVTWFAIWKNGIMTDRINASKIAIVRYRPVEQERRNE